MTAKNIIDELKNLSIVVVKTSVQNRMKKYEHEYQVISGRNTLVVSEEVGKKIIEYYKLKKGM